MMAWSPSAAWKVWRDPNLGISMVTRGALAPGTSKPPGHGSGLSPHLWAWLRDPLWRVATPRCSGGGQEKQRVGWELEKRQPGHRVMLGPSFPPGGSLPLWTTISFPAKRRGLRGGVPPG